MREREREKAKLYTNLCTSASQEDRKGTVSVMFGFSGELLLILGASAVLFKPKDIPVIARTAGVLVGKAVGYLHLLREQVGSVVQQSEASEVHKELRESLAQVQAIRHEIRSMSFMNPVPFTRVLDGPENLQGTGFGFDYKSNGENKPISTVSQDLDRTNSASSLHSQAITYTKLAETLNTESASSESSNKVIKHDALDGPTVLPVSAETLGLLPKRGDEVKGSDIMLQAILQEHVAYQFKDFISRPENEIPKQ
ncbi:hypothetical protein Cni_G14322 [Canna indica]|uniref:Uncharacterized protein n=1 Tax=Canna indica TaxID=4628 RepID=A0AAQ3QDV3_9LILI|nr:hypothetical protein Cni_G14322 [Canna indica]